MKIYVSTVYTSCRTQNLLTTARSHPLRRSRGDYMETPRSSGSLMAAKLRLKVKGIEAQLQPFGRNYKKEKCTKVCTFERLFF